MYIYLIYPWTPRTYGKNEGLGPSKYGWNNQKKHEGNVGSHGTVGFFLREPQQTLQVNNTAGFPKTPQMIQEFPNQKLLNRGVSFGMFPYVGYVGENSSIFLVRFGFLEVDVDGWVGFWAVWGQNETNKKIRRKVILHFGRWIAGLGGVALVRVVGVVWGKKWNKQIWLNKLQNVRTMYTRISKSMWKNKHTIFFQVTLW